MKRRRTAPCCSDPCHLLVAALLGLPGMAQAMAGDTRSDADLTYFVLRSDTQFDRTEGNGDARTLLAAQGRAINAWRDAHGGSIPVFVNGDITEFGHGRQWDVMHDHFKSVPQSYWGLGNHDYDNNVNDCAQNGCARDSLLHLESAVGRWGVDAFDLSKQNRPSAVEYSGSFAYSKTIGDITFIQLNNHFGYRVQFESRPFLGTARRFAIATSLPWLEKQLKAATEAGKFVVINQHRPPRYYDGGNPGEDLNKFIELVKRYRVLAVFHGHTHGAGKGQSIGETPVVDSGASFNKTFLVATVDRKSNQFRVQLARNNAVEEAPLLTVPLRSLSPPYTEAGISPAGGAQVLFVFGDNPRETALKRVEVDIGGTTHKFDVATRSIVQVNGLENNRRYDYVLRAYRAVDGRLEAEFQGSVNTRSGGNPPRNLCVGHWDATSGWFNLEWQDPIPRFPIPYSIRVEAIETGKDAWILRSLTDTSRRTQQRVQYKLMGRDPFAMTYAVHYWSAGWGTSPVATLDGKDLLKSGCQTSR